EGAGEAWLQIHPRFDSPELEEEMVILAEDRLAKTKSDETQALCVWTHETDTRRQALLQHRGYARGTWAEHQHRRFLDAPIPPSTPAPGYVVRALGDSRELPARSWISWRAFHPDEPDEAYEGWLWYLNIQRMPLYRRDLDIVAAAPTGELAAFCTLWYDDVTRTGYFEPVGTVPEHQRKGLGKAIMYEAMRRLQGMGGVVATVGGFSTAANALYGAVMPGEVEKLEPWIKAW
ncbi:MAG: GNAT family N-acetyltransferase, partial [Anaerolineae bacterium]|nr:GNAT family N-acetyltransferase [Anaerolineae bacterium]